MREFVANRSRSVEARMRALEDWASEGDRLDTTTSEQAATMGGGSAAVAAAAGGGGGGGGGPISLAGDVEGPSSGTTVVGIQEVAIAAPVAGDDQKVATYINGGPSIAWHTPPFKYRSESADYLATLNDFVIDVDATGAARTVTLPTAASAAQRGYFIRKKDASSNTVTADASGAETINGALTYVISVQFEAVLLVSTGSEWIIL